MTKEQKQELFDKGLTLPGRQLAGSDKQELRARAIAAGAAFYSEESVWVFPDAGVLAKFSREARPQPLPVAEAPGSAETKKSTPFVVPAVLPGKVRPPAVRSTSEVEPETEPETEEGFPLLQIQPSRFVFLTTKVTSPNHRVRLDRSEKRSEATGSSAVKRVKTLTEHTIYNPEEQERCEKLRSSLSGSLTKLCTTIGGGLYSLPLDAEEEFDRARLEVVKLAREFNQESTHYKLTVTPVKLMPVAVGEEEVLARKVAYEVQLCMREMREALDAMDVDAIRAAALSAKYKAKSLAVGQDRAILEGAVQAARQAAVQIAKEVREKGDLVEKEKIRINTSAIDSARILFLKKAVPEEIGDADVGQTSRRFDGLRSIGAIDPADLLSEDGSESPDKASRFMNLKAVNGD